MQRGRTAAQIAAVRERHRQVLELNLRGLTFQQIAVQLGYKNESSARTAWASALRLISEVEREQIRKVHGERLQRMRAKVWGEMAGREAPDPANPGKKIIVYNYPIPDLIDRALKIEIREAKLFGLDAPTRNEVSGPEGQPISLLAGVDAKDLERRLNRLTTEEQSTFIQLLNKMDGRGTFEDVETTATSVATEPSVPAVVPVPMPELRDGDAKGDDSKK